MATAPLPTLIGAPAGVKLKSPAPPLGFKKNWIVPLELRTAISGLLLGPRKSATKTAIGLTMPDVSVTAPDVVPLGKMVTLLLSSFTATRETPVPSRLPDAIPAVSCSGETKRWLGVPKFPAPVVLVRILMPPEKLATAMSLMAVEWLVNSPRAMLAGLLLALNVVAVAGNTPPPVFNNSPTWPMFSSATAMSLPLRPSRSATPIDTGSAGRAGWTGVQDSAGLRRWAEPSCLRIEVRRRGTTRR